MFADVFPNLTAFMKIFDVLKCHCYHVQMSATGDVAFDAWVGAVVRNNLLYASEQIKIPNTGRSLREEIDVFPLVESHPLYKELKDGFPKGYVLTDFSTTETMAFLQKDDLLSFSLLLIGQVNDYQYYFLEAIRQMCERGIGKPMTPFRLERFYPTPPFSLSDYLRAENEDSPDEITVRFQTPVILYRQREKKNTQLSYQDKTNRFPGLYQLIRSAYARLQKLFALYADPTNSLSAHFDDSNMENFLEKAGRPLLKSANIQYVYFQNTQKKGMKNEQPLSGYIGEQSYAGDFRSYLPLLHFMARLGVGNETVYGMGRYEIEERYSTKRIGNNQKIEVENEVQALDRLVQTNEENDLPNGIRLPLLIVRFINPISQKEIPVFADQLSAKVEQLGAFYHYPVIQCKRINGRAAIICIGEGTERIGGFFSSIGQFALEGKEEAMEMESVKAEKTIIQAWDCNFSYTLRKYLPFNSEKYVEYQKIETEKERHLFISQLLLNHILFFVKHIGIRIDKDMVCQITTLEEKAKVKYKNHTFISFDLKFRTNVSLPDYIGLGIGVSHGFGTVAKVIQKQD